MHERYKRMLHKRRYMDRKAQEACTVKGTLKLQWNATGRLLCQVASVVLTLCDPMDCGSPGPSVHGTPQARTLEWVAMPSPGDLPDPGIKPKSLNVLCLLH